MNIYKKELKNDKYNYILVLGNISKRISEQLFELSDYKLIPGKVLVDTRLIGVGVNNEYRFIEGRMDENGDFIWNKNKYVKPSEKHRWIADDIVLSIEPLQKQTLGKTLLKQINEHRNVNKIGGNVESL